MSLSSIDELQLPQTIELRQPVISIPNPRLDASSPFIWITRKFLSFLYILAISLSFKLKNAPTFTSKSTYFNNCINFLNYYRN